MALGALAQDIPVTIVPVGLTYFSAHKFRSRAVIEFGDPIVVEPEILQSFKNGTGKRAAIGTIMAETSKALKSLTVSAPDFEALQLIHAARRLYLTRPPYQDSTLKLSLSQTTELNRRLSKGYTIYAHTPEMISFTAELKSYTLSLTALNLKDHQLLSTSRNAHPKYTSILPKLLYRLTKLLILSLPTLPGLLLFTPIFIFTHRISHLKTAEALAGSSVKIKAHDVMATWKILIACALIPLFYTYYTLILILLYRYNLVFDLIPAHTSTWTIVAVSWVILPGITYASLLFGEQGMDLWKSIYPLLLSLKPGSNGTVEGLVGLERLVEQRKKLVLQVRDIVDVFGEEMFPDCEDVKTRKRRGPRSLFKSVSPELERGELECLDGFV